jgi:hypothetical protein
MILTTSTNTESNLVDRHVESVRAGFASIGNPEPRRRFTGAMPPELRDPTTTPEPVLESTDQRVLREAGILGKPDLRWLAPATVESLTKGVLAKKELAKLTELQAACDRLAGEIHAAAGYVINPAKLALAAPVGQLPAEASITAGFGGEEGRRFRKILAKTAAKRFYDEECVSVIVGIYSKIADHLAGVVTARHQAEIEAFEKFREVYGDEDGEAYRPSTGLMKLCARRRQLIDLEIPPHSPPSVRHALCGIVAFPAP